MGLGASGAVGGGQKWCYKKQRQTGRRRESEREREKALAASSRAESQDSKGDFHIMILQQCIAYFKDLITTAY